MLFPRAHGRPLTAALWQVLRDAEKPIIVFVNQKKECEIVMRGIVAGLSRCAHRRWILSWCNCCEHVALNRGDVGGVATLRQEPGAAHRHSGLVQGVAACAGGARRMC